MDLPIRRTLFAVACALLVAAPRLAAQESPPAPRPPEGSEAPSVGRPLADPGNSSWTFRTPLAAAGEEAGEGRSRKEGREKGAFEDPVETDRDAFTPVTKTAGQGLFILESAYSFIDNHGVAATHSFPELLLRYGLWKRVELRFGWNYEVGGSGNDIAGEEGDAQLQGPSVKRESRTYYGFKATVTGQEKWIPESAVIVQGFTPTGGQTTATQVVATYVLGWKLPNRWKLDAALRYGTSEANGDHFNVWAPSTVLRVPLGERWGVHAEYFGVFSQGQAHDSAHQYFSTGFHYLVTRNLELGARVGWGLNDQSPRFFSNVGFGWRF
jgi:hypothetical protein